ncbi:hypothetical protein EON66_02755, partial [archaeon]
MLSQRRQPSHSLGGVCCYVWDAGGTQTARVYARLVSKSRSGRRRAHNCGAPTRNMDASSAENLAQVLGGNARLYGEGRINGAAVVANSGAQALARAVAPPASTLLPSAAEPPHETGTAQFLPPMYKNVFLLGASPVARHYVSVEYDASPSSGRAVVLYSAPCNDDVALPTLEEVTTSLRPADALGVVAGFLEKHADALELRASVRASAPRLSLWSRAAEIKTRQRCGLVTICRVRYLGRLRCVSICEALARPAPGGGDVRAELRASIEADILTLQAKRAGTDSCRVGVHAPDPASQDRSDRQARRFELEQMDAKCMLRVLASSTAAARAASTVHEEGSHVSQLRVLAARCTLLMDDTDALIVQTPRGDSLQFILEEASRAPEAARAVRAFCRANMSTTVSTVQDMQFRSTSLWLPFARAVPGTLLLTEALRGEGAVCVASRGAPTSASHVPVAEAEFSKLLTTVFMSVRMLAVDAFLPGLPVSGTCSDTLPQPPAIYAEQGFARLIVFECPPRDSGAPSLRHKLLTRSKRPLASVVLAAHADDLASACAAGGGECRLLLHTQVVADILVDVHARLSVTPAKL